MESSDLVVIRDYDPSWPHAFANLAAKIRTAMGSLILSVEHIGSTAVPGLAAKPIIDLDVVLASVADLAEAIDRLSAIGYSHEGDLGVPGRHAFHSPPGEALHHLYVLAAGADELRRHLAFRDALRESELLRCHYSALKRCLAETFKGDRSSYTRAKSVFIASVIGTN
ncbi:MAG TPA: GrpB family protein [Steroidobacteraceae bacterium]|jgi:GrpB-like predicted nucleotidyltransferase (UPF0157 family)|nr:GrpB family protein [Steroidobacteraceae bacterium]